MSDQQSVVGHTPGPWHVLPGPSITVNGADNYAVAFIVRWHRTQQEDANARLIAAAPELLAALLIAADELRDVSTHHALNSWEAVGPQITAAIAKAEGPLMTTTVPAQPTSVAATLKAARALIEDPKHWTKGTYARPSKVSQERVQPDSNEAGAWCALGALKCVDGDFEQPSIATLAWAISPGADYLHLGTIIEFNDGSRTKHRDVLAAFDKAIALAEARS